MFQKGDIRVYNIWDGEVLRWNNTLNPDGGKVYYYVMYGVQMNKGLKQSILALREEGKSYNEIVRELGCSKSIISYYCGEKYRPKQPDDRKCLRCGSLLKSRRATTFCSRECHSLYRRAMVFDSIEKGEYDVVYSNPTLRAYLEFSRGYKCEQCDISEWNGNTITLQVDHIDGDSDNNSLDNIRLLCPNCHSQTSNYCGRNKGNGGRRSDIRAKSNKAG